MSTSTNLSPPLNSGRRTDRLALLACTIYVGLTFLWYCVWHYFIGERSGDEVIFENCFWNAANGNGLHSSIEGVHHLVVHFSPALYVLVALYKLLPTMHTIHLFVSLTAAGAGFTLYRLTRDVTENHSTSFVVMLAFLLHPTVILQTFMAFHEHALIFLPVVLIIHAYVKNSPRGVLIWGTVAVAIREDTFLLLLGLAVYGAISGRRFRMSLTALAVTATWAIAYTLSTKFLGDGLPKTFANTYGHWGSTPLEMMRSVLTDPVGLMRHLFARVPIAYVAQLLVPFLVLLPFGSRVWLLSIPFVMLVLLADHSSRMFQVRLHYSSIPVAILFLSSVLTLRRWKTHVISIAGRWNPRWTTLAAAGVLAISVLVAPFWITRAISRFNPYVSEIHALLARIPTSASVTAPRYLANRLAKREHVFLANKYENVVSEYVIVEDRSKLFFGGDVTHAFFSPELAARLEANGYEQVYEQNGWHIYRKVVRIGAAACGASRELARASSKKAGLRVEDPVECGLTL